MSATAVDAGAVRLIQRRTVTILAAAQMFTSVGVAAVVTTGPMLSAALAGESLAGGASTAQAVGAAVAAAILARLAASTGRRPPLLVGIAIALIGALVIILGAIVGSFALVLLGSVLSGSGNATNLQARFAATDLARPQHRGRDLSTVVWLGTVGVVVGPNLIGLGEGAATALGLPVLAGLFILGAASQVVSLVLVAVGLRPDPLVRARELAGEPLVPVRRPGLRAGLRAIWVHPRARAGLAGVVIGHGLMAGFMGMTPVHMMGMGAEITIVGFVVSLHMFAMYGFAPLWGLLADRIGGPAVVLIGLATILASGVVGAAAGEDQIAVAVSLILLGLGWGLSTVAGAVLIVSAVGDAERIAAQGASDTLMNLSSAVFGLLAGFGLSGVGYEGLGIAVAIVAALAAVFAALSARRRKAIEPAESAA